MSPLRGSCHEGQCRTAGGHSTTSGNSACQPPPPLACRHVLYAIMLRAMGMGQQMRLPKFAERFVAGLPTA